MMCLAESGVMDTKSKASHATELQFRQLQAAQRWCLNHAEDVSVIRCWPGRLTGKLHTEPERVNKQAKC